MDGKKKKAVVIGSGIAGIAIAIRLAVKGYNVHVYEANAYAGGKLSEIFAGPFRFDAGPSLLTMPWLIDELFRLAGEDPKEHFRYERLQEITHYFYEDGTTLTSHAEPRKFAEELQAKTGEPAERVLRYLEDKAQLFRLTAHMFLESSLSEMSTFISAKAFKTGLQLWRLDFLRTMHNANKSFFNDDRVVQLFDRYATYNGSDPYRAPATLSVISHLEFNTGAYFPEGGMYTITQSLVKLSQRLGVQFHFNTRVTGIDTGEHGVTGIRYGNEHVQADVVVSNMDAVQTYSKLLPAAKAPKLSLSQPRSNSAIIFYWGISKSFPQLGLHNVFFARDYKEEFRHLSQLGIVSGDPTIYINISSKLAPADAPSGMENWFVMINVPPDTGQNWDQVKTAARNNILTKLNRLLGTDIAALIVAEDTLDPALIEQRTSSYQGAIYGSASNGRFSAFLKPSNINKHIPGLYFCGGGSHPGGGIPLCLLSARIAAHLIYRYQA